MRTRFSTRREAEQKPDPRVYGTQIELDGLVLRGGIPEQHETGAYMAFTELEGWWEPTKSSGETTERILAHGGWDNRAFYGARYITVRGILWGDNDRQIEAGLNALAAAIPLDQRRPLAVRRHGEVLHVMARQEDQPQFDWQGGDTAEFDIQFSAADYRRLVGDGSPDADWTIHGPVGVPASRGGITFPLKFPIKSDAETTTGRITTHLAGTAPPNVVVEFDGPVDQPSVRDIPSSKRTWFDISLSAGQTLTVNLNTHEVLLNGVSRRGTRRGTWIKPAREHVLEFTANGSNDQGRMTVRTQEAYL